MVAFNTFTRNAGYLDASVLYIRARGRSGVSIYSTAPTDANIFCVGYTIQENTFTENVGCPRYVGATVKVECVEYGDSSSIRNDRITHSTLSSTSGWYAITGYTYTTSAMANSYTYSTTKTIAGDYKIVTFKSNTFLRNSASNGHGLVDVKGVPRVVFDSDSYTNNGDAVSNTLNLYGGSVMTAASSEMSIDLALATPLTYLNSFLM